jgi:amino acid permease
MAILLKAIGGVTALVLLAITLFSSVLALGGFLLSAIKVLIVVIFIAVVAIIGISILRDRRNKRHETTTYS